MDVEDLEAENRNPAHSLSHWRSTGARVALAIKQGARRLGLEGQPLSEDRAADIILSVSIFSRHTESSLNILPPVPILVIIFSYFQSVRCFRAAAELKRQSATYEVEAWGRLSCGLAGKYPRDSRAFLPFFATRETL